MSGVMSAIVGLLVFCTLVAIVSFIGTSVALYLLCKDIDIDDVTMEDEQ